MRSEYARKRLRLAAEAVAPPTDDVRAALYAAHLQLHTVLPDALPEGEPRRRIVSIHDRLTHRAEGEEGGVVEVIRRMDEAGAAALARDIRELWDLVETLDEGAPDPDAGRALRQAPRRVRLRVPTGGSVLIALGSTDGHTRSLMGFAAAELSSAGYEVAVREAAHAEAGVEVAGFAAVLVAASIHWGRYQSSVIDFAKENHEALNARAAALISVSLSAAGVAQPEPGTLDDYVDALRNETQWEPSAVHHVGGRIRHSGYDYFQRLAITLIAAQRGDTCDASLDYDLADYAALKAFVTDFVAG